MSENKIKIGVIFGGKSTEHEVSVVSGSSIIKNLDKTKYEITPIYISKEGNWYIYKKEVEEIEIFNIGENPKELEKIENEFKELKKQDIIFPVLHGLYGEDGTIQGLLELIQKPYVGCKVLSSSLCMNKIYTKIIFEKAKINQAKAIILNVSNKGSYIYIDDELNHIEKSIQEISQIIEQKLKYPVFIKPSNSGSSVGVNKATQKKDLEEAIKKAQKYDKEILIEQAIIGKEVECAVIGTDKVEASCVGQILSADEFYDYNSKYKNAESKTIIPAKIPEQVQEQVRKIAIKAYKAVNATGLARVDFFIEEKTNKIYINEINTMPGFTEISMYPKLWDHNGIKYNKLLDMIIEDSK